MANSLAVEVLEEGPRNAVVRLIGIVDSGDMSEPSAITLSQFSTNDRGTLNGLKVVDVDFAVTEPLIVQLDWNSNAPQTICALSGSDQMLGEEYGGMSPDRAASGYDGSINLTTKGFVPGSPCSFTITLEMVKKYA